MRWMIGSNEEQKEIECDDRKGDRMRWNESDGIRWDERNQLGWMTVGQGETTKTRWDGRQGR